MKSSNKKGIIISALKGYKKKKFSKEETKAICSIYKSKKISYESIKEFEVLGCGGNGIVFGVIENNGKEYCLKVLYDITKNKPKRFRNEIKALQEISKCNLTGVVPILFDGLDEKLDFYAMNRFQKYNVEDGKSFRKRIEDLIYIANTIKAINEETKLEAHRDIKLSNILTRDSEIFISDFGLVKFRDSEDNITKDDFRIGPLIISPIEFYKEIPNWDYHISDVYLFSKIVWQILNKSKSGFWGEYTGDVDNFLTLNSIKEKYPGEKIITVEPINEMIINTTGSNLFSRKEYRIDYCIKCLKNELELLNADKIDTLSQKFDSLNDDVNKFMFFSSNKQRIITLDDGRAIEILEDEMYNNNIPKSIYHINLNNGSPMTINIESFKYANNSITIIDKFQTKFFGIVKFALVNNVKKEVIIRFEDNKDEMYENIVNYKIGVLSKNKKYLLDKDCELSISFSNSLNI